MSRSLSRWIAVQVGRRFNPSRNKRRSHDERGVRKCTGVVNTVTAKVLFEWAGSGWCVRSVEEMAKQSRHRYQRTCSGRSLRHLQGRRRSESRSSTFTVTRRIELSPHDTASVLKRKRKAMRLTRLNLRTVKRSEARDDPDSEIEEQ